MKKLLFTGCGTALVTPMTSDGAVNEAEFERLVEYQIVQGADALIVCGTTGESATLSDEEHKRLFRKAVDVAQKRVPIIAGTGTNDTAHTIWRSYSAAECGADGLLMVTPYYNKTSQKGLVAHYRAVLEQVPLPTIVYNVPSRTGMNIEPKTARQLADLEWVCGMKEASGNTAQAAQIAALCQDKLPLYSGNDSDTLALLSLGGKGVISVVSNLIPAKIHNLCTAWQNGDTDIARLIQLALVELCDAMFCEVNPIPVKYAMTRMGWSVGDCRLPLYRIGEEKKQKIDRALQMFELIS